MTLESNRVAVCTPVAPLFDEPRVASAMISQYLAGRVAEVLETRDDWFRILGADDYEGWMHRGYLAYVPDAGRRSAQSERISLGCVTTNPAGARRALPLGSYLSSEERVRVGEAIDAAKQDEVFPAEAGAITRSAQNYFEGTSYLWGGVTPWGADCSGLVQSVYWLHGIQLRRDAWQQAMQGAPGEDRLIDARAADLLFFSDRVDRHITHVAIALGGGCLVHLALGRGGYAVEKLDDAKDPYVRKLHDRFIGARRILAPVLATS
ncbi:MAG: NlpC/P60 family protein [Gemmatimonadota bacterium]